MSAECEVASVFGDQLKALSSAGTKQRRAEASEEPEEPQKWYPATKGGKGQQSWSSRGWANKDRQSDRAWGESQPLTDTVSATQVRELLAMLTRLTLRQEDSIAALQADTSFMLYMDTAGDMSMTTTLWEMSQRWKKLKEEESSKVTQSLRVTLMTGLFMELKSRMELALDAKTRPTFEKHGWLTEGDDPKWAFQIWDPEAKDMKTDPSQDPIPHTHMLKDVARLLTLLPTNLVQKFHATRPMAAEYQSNTLTMMIMISNRGQPADELYGLLRGLCDSCALRLVGARMRPHRQRRQPLAQALELQARGLLNATRPQEAPPSKEEDKPTADK